MRNRKWNKAIWFSVITVMLMTLLLPVTIALAEDFGTRSTVLLDAGEILGDTYQRHSWYSDGRHWVMYATDDEIVYTSSEDNITWETPILFANYSCTLPEESCCNGSVFSLWYDVSLDRVDVVYLTNAGYNTSVYYRRGRPETDGTIAWNNIHTAMNATANVSYMHPSICTNTLDYPFVALMAWNISSHDYEGWVTTSTTNNSIWTFATNSSAASVKAMTNTSIGPVYPSVIPVSDGNVSLQYIVVPADKYLIGQNFADYDIATDTWSYGTAEYPLPATSYLDGDSIFWHSEVGSVLNLSEPDDVFMVAAANDSVIGKYLWFGRYGSDDNPWATAANLGTGWYAPALGKRNALDYLTVTAIEVQNQVDLWNADYNMTSHTWGTLAVIPGVDATSWPTIQTDYDNANSDYLGVLYNDNTVAFIPDVEFGCYGCDAPVTPSDAGTTIMQIIIPLLIAITVVVLALKGIGEVNTVNAIVILIAATLIGVISFVVIKQLVLGM